MEKIKLEETPKVELFDFGFSLTTEAELKRDEVESLKKTSQTLTATQQKLTALKDMFWPLLENLKKDPEKEIIRWPNRVPTIDNFMHKIETFIAQNPE